QTRSPDASIENPWSGEFAIKRAPKLSPTSAPALMCMGSAAAHAGAHTMPNVSNATAILGTARPLLRPDRCRDLRGCHFRTAQRFLNCAVPGFYGSRVLRF